jgi:hypothetical protein
MSQDQCQSLLNYLVQHVSALPLLQYIGYFYYHNHQYSILDTYIASYYGAVLTVITNIDIEAVSVYAITILAYYYYCNVFEDQQNIKLGNNKRVLGTG